MRSLAALLASLALAAVVLALGAAASVSARYFYAALERPAWAPPGWVFGPVWTALYAMMAVAAWLVWRERDRVAVRPALSLYVLQLGLNALWSWVFFAWRQGGWGLADIVALWIVLLATLIAFWRVRPGAGALLVPYLAWVSFAAALNAAVWRLNPGRL